MSPESSDRHERIVREILGRFGRGGVDATFTVADRTYHVFAYPSPGRDGPRIRWNLYEVSGDERSSMRGLTFGLSDGVQEALEEVVSLAERHARDGELPPRRSVSFRPPPFD